MAHKFRDEFIIHPVMLSKYMYTEKGKQPIRRSIKQKKFEQIYLRNEVKISDNYKKCMHCKKNYNTMENAEDRIQCKICRRWLNEKLLNLIICVHICDIY